MKKPWEKRKSIAIRWKYQGKNTYSEKEYAELKNNGPLEKPTSVIEALQQYEDWPSEKTYNTLKEMYFAIPKEERRFCLRDIDAKDGPVVYALELEDET